ncbi:hypothetical protein [Streptomyces viridosporus]|uniref:hypothetical protein n=1 Tax=Streptomyces viridosporus TaxID=67581 RepID=UPI003319D2DC
MGGWLRRSVTADALARLGQRIEEAALRSACTTPLHRQVPSKVVTKRKVLGRRTTSELVNKRCRKE